MTNILDAIVAFFTDEVDDLPKEITTCNNCGSKVTYNTGKKAEVKCPECNMPTFKTPRE